MSSRKLMLFVKVCVSVGLIALILAKTDLRELVTAMQNLDVPMLGVALGCMIVGVLIRSYKWQLLLHAQQARIPFRSSVSLSFMAMFVNNFFLGTLGGDAYRVYRANDYSKTIGGATSSVLMERATGFLGALLLILVIGSVLALDSQELVSVRLLTLISLVGAALGVLLFGGLLVSSKLASTALFARVPILRRFVQDLTASVWDYKARPGTVVVSLVLSLLFHVIQATSVYVFILAANGDASIFPLFFVTPLVGVLVVLPISINGIGVREGLYVFYLQQLGLTNPVAVLVALAGRVGNILLSLYGGLLILLQMWGRRKESRRARKRFVDSAPARYAQPPGSSASREACSTEQRE